MYCVAQRTVRRELSLLLCLPSHRLIRPPERATGRLLLPLVNPAGVLPRVPKRVYAEAATTDTEKR